MKKLIAIALAVVMLIAVFAVVGPVGAIGQPPPSEITVYEANIVPTSWGTHSLDEGEVKVWADGSVKVKIKGAVAMTTYRVFFGQQPDAEEQITAWILDWTSMGTITTDSSGDVEKMFVLPGSIPSPVTAPVFAINYPQLTLTQFATGF